MSRLRLLNSHLDIACTLGLLRWQHAITTAELAVLVLLCLASRGGVTLGRKDAEALLPDAHSAAGTLTHR